MPENKPYAISLAVNYDSESSGTKMEIVYITYGHFDSPEDCDKYCMETMVKLYPSGFGKGKRFHYNRRHSFREITEEQFRSMKQIEIDGGPISFDYSLE